MMPPDFAAIPFDYTIQRRGPVDTPLLSIDDVLAAPDDSCRVVLRVLRPSLNVMEVHFHALMVDQTETGAEFGYWTRRSITGEDIRRLEDLRDRIGQLLEAVKG